MWIPFTKIKTNSITLFDYWEGNRSSRTTQKLKGADVRKNINGQLSKEAQKKLRDAVNTLFYFSRKKRIYQEETKKYYYFRLNFITLTLTEKQKHTDKYITSKILGEFLRKWRKRNPELQYVWKAEKQDNGNIHYHLTTNVFIHWKVLREKWNKELAKHGYLNRIAGLEANSTDIKAVRKVQNIAAYLCAYITKKDIYKQPLKRFHRINKAALMSYSGSSYELPKQYFQNIKDKVSCSLWSASKALLNYSITDCLESTEIMEELERFVFSQIKPFKSDYAAVYYLKPEYLKLCPKTNEALNKLYNERLKDTNISEHLIFQVV